MGREPSDEGRLADEAGTDGRESTDEIRALIPHLTNQLREARGEILDREERIRALEAELERLIVLLEAATAAGIELEEAMEQPTDKNNAP